MTEKKGNMDERPKQARPAGSTPERKRRRRKGSDSEPTSGSEPASEGLTGSESEAKDGRPSLRGLVGDLRKGDEATRLAAAKNLGGLGSRARKAVPYLAKALSSDDVEAVRFQSARALGQIGANAARGVPALLRALGEGKKDRSRDTKSVSGAAARAIKRIGAASVPHLISALADDDQRKPAARILKSMPFTDGAEVREAFEELLDGKDNRATLAALSALGGHGEQALSLMLLATASSDEETSKHGLLALRALGKSGVSPLAKALDEDQVRVRASAARALGSIAKHVSQKAVSRMMHRLVDALNDDDPLVRSSAVAALANLTEFEDRVLPHLIQALGDEDAGVDLQAVMAILHITSDRKALTERMIGVLERSKNAYTRVGCCMLLMHMGPDAKAAVDALIEAVEGDSAPEVREYANLALQAIRTPSMRLQVIRTASLRLKVVDEEDPKKNAPKKKPRSAKRKPAARRSSGPRRRR